MTDISIASSEADSIARQAVEQHHAQLAGRLTQLVGGLQAAASKGERAAAHVAVDDLVAWAERDLVPHALAEEAGMYPAARATTEGRLLIEAMLTEHHLIGELVRELAAASDPLPAAGAARALQVVFDSHLRKENELILPLLVAAPGVHLSQLLQQMHVELERREKESPHHAPGAAPHDCTCEETDGSNYPVLDARDIPHSIRHATIFGALDTVRPGGGLVLIASHDPLPLLAQIETRTPAAFDVTYLERGPLAWKLRFTLNAG